MECSRIIVGVVTDPSIMIIVRVKRLLPLIPGLGPNVGPVMWECRVPTLEVRYMSRVKPENLLYYFSLSSTVQEPKKSYFSNKDLCFLLTNDNSLLETRTHHYISNVLSYLLV